MNDTTVVEILLVEDNPSDVQVCIWTAAMAARKCR